MKTRNVAMLLAGGLGLCCAVYFVFVMWAACHLILPVDIQACKSKLQVVSHLLRNVTGSLDGRVKASALPDPVVTGALRHYRSLVGNQSLSLNCSSCALVSSSGYLLGRKAGREIDGRDCVLRLNMAPVAGYEDDVGRRTTLRVFNFFLLGVEPAALPSGSQLLAWGLGYRPGHLRDATALQARLANVSATIYGQSKEGELEAEAVFTQETGHSPRATKSWISTGWFAMMIGLDLCRHIHVYGMVPADYCLRRRGDAVAYHYYEEPWVKECATYRQAETSREGGHRFVTEKAVFARWSRRYNITFHYPSWPASGSGQDRGLDTPFVQSQHHKGALQWLFA